MKSRAANLARGSRCVRVGRGQRHGNVTSRLLSDARTEWATRHSSGELQFIAESEGACTTCALDVQLLPSDGGAFAPTLRMSCCRTTIL